MFQYYIGELGHLICLGEFPPITLIEKYVWKLQKY